MPKRVIGDVVALAHRRLDQLGVVKSLRPDHDKRGLHLVTGQQPQILRRPHRMRTVINAQHDRLTGKPRARASGEKIIQSANRRVPRPHPNRTGPRNAARRT